MRLLFVLLLASCAFIFGNFETVLNTVITSTALLVVVIVFFLADFRLQRQRKRLRGIAVGSIGLVVGFLIARLIAYQLVEPLLEAVFPTKQAELGYFSTYSLLLLSVVLGYFGFLVGRSSADELRIFTDIGPKTEKRVLYLIDLDALVDGRLVRLSSSPLLRGEIVIPRYVVEELESLSSSKDAFQKSRGQRGLDNLKSLESQRDIRIFIRDIEVKEGAEDRSLLRYADEHNAILISKREEIKKAAMRTDVPLIDFNEISSLLSPDVATGDEFVIKLIKPGKEMDQAVGYLNDGNMVVVENARSEIGKTVRVTVTGIHQTKAGTLIFAQLKK
ncbi:MAG: TRAM domain-containing protein [Candidatus Glassbacteria bacterium]